MSLSCNSGFGLLFFLCSSYDQIALIVSSGWLWDWNCELLQFLYFCAVDSIQSSRTQTGIVKPKKHVRISSWQERKGFHFWVQEVPLGPLESTSVFSSQTTAVQFLDCGAAIWKKKKEWILPNSKNKVEDKSRHWSYSVLLVKFQGKFSFAPCNNVDKGTPFCFICEFSMTQKPSKKTTTCLWFI